MAKRMHKNLSYLKDRQSSKILQITQPIFEYVSGTMRTVNLD